MQERRLMQVRTSRIIELVQKGHALAQRTGDDALADACTSLLAAVMPKDLKNALVRIARVPHEQQIDFINNAISGAQHANTGNNAGKQ